MTAEYQMYNLTIGYQIQIAGDIIGYDGKDYIPFDISEILNYGSQTTANNTIVSYQQ